MAAGGKRRETGPVSRPVGGGVGAKKQGKTLRARFSSCQTCLESSYVCRREEDKPTMPENLTVERFNPSKRTAGVSETIFIH